MRCFDIWRCVAPENNHGADSEPARRGDLVGQQFAVTLVGLGDDDVHTERPVGHLMGLRDPPLHLSRRHSADAEDAEPAGVGHCGCELGTRARPEAH